MSQEKTYFQPQKTIFSLKKLLMFLGKLSAHVSYKDVLIKKKVYIGFNYEDIRFLGYIRTIYT